MLNKQDITRYNRHLLLSEIGEKGQWKLKQGKVLVVGAGGLGCPVLLYLTAAGVGTIGIIDFDTVEESNLQRQVLFGEEDIGKLKADVAAKKLRKQNSLITVVAYCQKLSVENVEEIFTQYDIIVDCTDNFSSRYLINDACVLLHKPMVYGSIHRFQGQVSVFNLGKNRSSSPTYRCLFPQPPLQASIPSCSEIGVLGVLPGIIGTIQATEVIKMVTGIGKLLSGRLLIIDALSMASSIIEIERNPLTEKNSPSSMEELKNTDYNFDCDATIPGNEMTVEELQEYVHGKKEIQLLDVRNKDELPLIEELYGLKFPLSEIENNIDKISRNKKVIVYCKTGKRSAMAIELLQNKFHFTNLYSLKGGIDEWMRFKKAKKQPA